MDRLFPSKKAKMDPEVADDGTLELCMKYDRKDYAHKPSPKLYLHEW